MLVHPICDRCGEPWRWPFHVCTPRWRYALALPFCVLALVLSLGCTPSELRVQAATADAIGRSVNAAAPSVVDAYERDCAAAVKSVPGGEAVAALSDCRARWRPAWAVFEGLAAAHDAWIAQLAAGKAPNWPALLKAACAVPRIVLTLAPEAPLGMLVTLCSAAGGGT